MCPDFCRSAVQGPQSGTSFLLLILGPILTSCFALLSFLASVLIKQCIGLTSQDSAPAAMLFLSDLREFGCWGSGRLCAEPPTLYFVEVGRPGMAIKKEEARRAVLSEYDSWAKNTPTRPA